MRRGRGARIGGLARIGVTVLGCAALASCSSGSKLSRKVDPKYGVSASPRVIEPGQPVPKGGGTYRVGKPYVVAGRTYYPDENRRYRAEGIASWYGDDFHGRLTANGEIYDMEAISAAHPTLPMPSYVRVTNLSTRRSLIVRVNDRGPFHADREIDLSGKAAELLGFRGNGLARVRVEYVGQASLEGSDDRKLLATLRHDGPAPDPSTVRVASARGFVPNQVYGSPSFRGPVPVPQGRPFELGERPSGAEAPRPDGRAMAATRPAPGAEASPMARVDAAVWARPIEPPGPAAISAFAPMRSDRFQAVTSGRGLY